MRKNLIEIKMLFAVCTIVAGLMMFGCTKSENAPNAERGQTAAEAEETAELTQSKTADSGQSEKESLTLDDVINAPVTDEQYFTYEETEGGIIILKCTCEDDIIVLPDTIGGKEVVELDAAAFSYIRGSVKGIYISNGIEIIEDNTFANMEQLEIVVLGSGVKEIGKAFVVSSVRMVSILSPNIDKIVSYAFNNCKELEEVYINGDVEEIEMAAFTSCAALQAVYFEGDVNVIDEKAFFAVTPVIYGPAGSNIQQYADEKGFIFAAQ
ncbi:MAG: leucine-rich repeat domain-containing protein [Lachnospiraceae bacterium]|nr:leucine-rich repeat domain-containing protein [Lachnospiraceae bacterium]